ncbi:hypothetical protein EDB87DRAFT_1595972 [Lactarius vividus]|nr:hypothetical protein EDB87DRAFT_1595972 [Lactarius vividus]
MSLSLPTSQIQPTSTLGVDWSLVPVLGVQEYCFNHPFTSFSALYQLSDLRSQASDRRSLPQMLYYRMNLVHNTLSSCLSHLPAELGTRLHLFVFSANALPTSLWSLISVHSSLTVSDSVSCLSTHHSTPCLLAFFGEENSMPFCSDIPGWPETQVERWHAMEPSRL